LKKVDSKMTLQAALAELDITIDSAQEERLLCFLDELLRWNQSINLTAITNRDEALVKHLVDSLTLLPLLRGDETLLDMGSGGGLPGLPLKIVMPGLSLTSIDAVAKKISFQKHVIRTFALTGAVARHGRLEELGRESALAGHFDLVVARAFASLADCVRLARPFLQPGGKLIAMKGPEGEREVLAAEKTLSGAGFSLQQIDRLDLPGGNGERTLITLELLWG
jgi:16S rRNA (guanine527-N7)-methyltransferase